MANTKTYYDTFASVSSAADTDIIVIQTDGTSSLDNMKKTTVGALRQPLVDQIAAGSMAVSESGKFISGISVDASGHVSADLTSFRTTIDNASMTDGNIAPSASAVRSFVDRETNNSTGIIGGRIESKIAGLTAATAGGNGQYISQISETGGKISATAVSLETNINNNSQNAPTSSAVKTYVDTKIQGLTGSVGGAGALVTSVSETGGKISGSTIDIDTTLSNSASKIPTSNAVNSVIQGLTGSVGGAGKLVTSISETSGKISGSTIDIEQDLSNSASKIPTSSAVNKAINTKVLDSINALDRDTGDLSSGATGKYFTRIIETDGAISACSADLVTYVYTGGTAAGTWSVNPPNNKYPISALAAKNYTDYQSSLANKRIDDLDYVYSSSATGAGDGYFINQVNQTDGKISTIKTQFFTGAIQWSTAGASGASRAYSQNASVAPTVKSVATEIKRLDERVDYANGIVSGMSAGPFGSQGVYLEQISQIGGQITGVTVRTFLDTIPTGATGNTTGSVTPPNANAVRLAINALNKAESGGAGKYIRAIKEDTGVITATTASFDTGVGPSTGASAATNNNAPTSLAVRTAIDTAKKEILEQSEAMSYLGAVNSTTGMRNALLAKRPGAASFDTGDTFIANGEFALASGTAYAVYPGDMIIANSDSSTTASTPVVASAFDIIQGADNSVMSAATTASSGLIAIFNSDNKRIITTSTETITTLAERQAAAAKSATSAASAAACSASSAIFAESEIIPYLTAATGYANDAKTAMTAATGYENDTLTSLNTTTGYESSAKSALNTTTGYRSSALTSLNTTTGYENNTLKAMTGAQDSSDAAYNALTGAINYRNLTNNALTAATGHENNALKAMTGAQNSSTAAYKALTGARDSSDAAYNAMTGAQNSSTAAYKALTGARDSSDAAYNALTGARDSSDAAYNAMTGAQNSSTAAYNAMTAATGHANNAKTAMTGAQGSSTAANSAMIGAQDSSTAAYTAMTAALYFASSTTLYYILDGATAAANNASISASCSASSADISYTAAASALSSAVNHSNSYFIHNSSYASATASEVQTIKGNLSVNNLTATNMVQASGVLANVLTANTINQNSSRKVKENITPAVISALDLVDTVDIVNYNYINDDEKTQKIGFIAEDTDRLLSTPHQNAMDYGNCIGVLLKAVQEITKGMEKLEKRIEKME